MQLTLKAARVNKGLSQKEAAKMIGVTKETIGNWERGKSYPNVLLLKSIEETYQVDYNDLIFLPENNALSVQERS